MAAIVGTVLVGINQGDAMFHGLWPASLLWKVPLMYVVPFAVASVGAPLSSRIQSTGT
ncbi:MAG: nitrate/nitrite transporter NrtS [Candidatus Rokubacteria bacterium]|nr:nitrate/nitrite transporter NrtS [Candidatus Rokubacteria bacterium]